MTDAIVAGHALPAPLIEDVVLRRGDDSLLNRAAWIDGLGLAVKAATLFPGNRARDLPTVNGGVMLFDDLSGGLDGIVDFHLVTKWKTAADSLLAARRLARADAQNILIVGAGTVGRTMVAAYGTAFPDARFTIWNRSPEGAARFAEETGAAVADDLEQAVNRADIIATATMSTEPVVLGDWLRPGQHLDLIGAYRADMREVDDAAMARARVFVDARATTLHHIGELIFPLGSGAIVESDIIADFYQPDLFCRTGDDDITLCKNGGGAHLDLMVARHILDRWRAR
jgi:ornithine cyclodeaminase/alanine dehydrogenase-like protein (mu-crystallin family)